MVGAAVLLGCCAPGQSEQPVFVSALPQLAVSSGEGDCEQSVTSKEQRGVEPSLAAWVQTADAIFLGTVTKVERVEAPIHKIVDGVDAGPVNKEECGDEINYAIRITFGDVESLHGASLPETITIHMGRFYADSYPGFYLDESGVAMAQGHRVYTLGSRIGAALTEDDEGGYHWQYRQFEVVDNEVHLQQLDDSDMRYCNSVPYVMHIPDKFEGSGLNELRDAIVIAADEDLDASSTAAINHHHTVPTVVNNPDFKLYSQSHCHVAGED